ncbi:hypothetical protein CMI44_01845 [Candidatus Pacearchaeota archaeon]|nr:hypothetical protein [Candidatus Pacearchaeota archaeon]|tara:strand:+ start:221 stop:433 length:213 start_codon:yes stop_codon:yes gene_type:complete
MGKIGGIVFFLYGLLGLYIINLAFGFIALPEVISNYNNWIFGIGGALLIITGFRYWWKNRIFRVSPVASL